MKQIIQNIQQGIVLFLIIITGQSLCAQDPAVSYTLNATETATKNYTARDEVKMLPGFSFSAVGGNTFKAKIDAGLLFPPTANTYALPNGQITIDPTQGAVVGSIPGQFAVSPTGAATYTIPIEVPAGINGMQPNISISYNSQGGNGIVGWGWNLSGMSAITRTGKTIYHDNAVATVQLNTADNLLLDGQRLLKNNTVNHLSDGAEYRTEIETYSNITFKSINGYLCFEVKTKEGITMEYGSSADSYIEAQGSTTPLTWLLRKVTDANGNYMIYNYGENNANGEFWLSSIQYTGNTAAGVNPVNIIEFVYQSNRFDSQTSYIAGSKMKKSLLLNTIIINTENTVLKTYNFNYTNDDFYTKLSSVSLIADGVHYPQTTIDWEKLNSTENPEFTTTTTSYNGLSYGSLDNSMLFIDFNNDGYADIIRPVFDGMLYRYIGWELYNSTSFGQNFILTQTENINNEPELFPHVGNYLLYPVDINQDGFTDLAEIRGSYDRRNFTIDFLINNNGTLERQNFNKIIGSSNPYTTFNFEFGDYIGDGNIYLLIKETDSDADSGALQLLSIDLNTNSTNVEGIMILNEKADLTIVTDANGNGIPELFFPESSTFREYDKNSNSFPIINITLNTNNFLHEVQFADFNADGKTDVLIYDISVGTWSIKLSTGNSFTEYSCPLIRSRTKDNLYDENYNDFYYISDFNGDNQKDIIEIYPENNAFKVNVYYFNGNEYIQGDYGYITSNNFYYNVLLPYYDLNADGNCDLVEINSAFSTIAYRSFTTTESERLITSIAKGFNEKYNVIYNNLSDANVYSTDLTGLTQHVISPCVSLPIVTEAILEYDEEPVTSTSYRYKGLRIHTKGKGILGFKEFVEENTTQNIKTISEFGYNTTYFNTYPIQQIVLTSSESPVSTTTFTNNVIDLGGKHIFPYVSSQTSTNHLTGLSGSKTMSNFDDYGNPRSIQTTKGGLIETQSISYIQKGSWCPNKPDSVTVVNTYEGQSETRNSKYYYDEAGNLTKEILNPINPNFKVTTEYKNINTFGLAQTVEVKAKDANGIEQTRTSSITYTPTGTSKGRFVATKTNVLGVTTTYNWDEIRGLLNSETTQGKTIYYSYNGFGRLKETSYADGNRKTQVLQWAGGSGPTGAVYYSYVQTSGSAPVTTWFDALGREIQKDTYGLYNENEKKNISVSTEYYTSGANKGRLYRVSEPYFEGDTKTWEQTYSVYDSFGRSTTVQLPTGNITTVYDNLSTTVSTPEGTKTTSLNNSGFVASSTINVKTVSYTYYPSGLTKTATPQGGQALSMEYNLQGKRIKLTDPDAGIIESKYNGFGELVEEKQKVHSDNFITTTQYLEPTTGRLNSINRNGEVISYSYDTQNRVNYIEISDQHKQTFSYDDFDRVTNIREEINTNIYNRETTYDALGRIKKEIYPSGFYTLNTYDNDYGYLTEVKDKYNRQIWKVKSENARGQITEVQRGGKTTTFGFDSRGLPSSIQASGIVNLTYNFGDNGNLIYRQDNINSQNIQKEEFLYDGMNRLTNWDIYQNNVLVKPNSIVYNSNTGTIISKSDLDNWTMMYGENGKPHALTGISGVPTIFSADSLDVTYTDFKKIKTLTEGSKHYILTYGIDDQRRKSEYQINGVTQKTKYYLGDYEEETDNLGNTKKIHYLSGGAILIITNGVESLYYGYSDYQGNLIAVANEAGTVVERYAYDPWGKRRNPENWAQDDTRTSWIIDRGYTMHEHLDAFGIINMNGRVYDPMTAMFYSPDPFVQAPENWLNYNRYSYVLNNPLKYKDPSGEKFIDYLIVIGVFILDIVVVSVGIGLTIAGGTIFGPVGAGVGVLAAVGIYALYSEWKNTWYAPNI